MSTPVLYSIDFSPPCRGVRLTAQAIGLQLDVKNVNLLAGEHMAEAFTKINPQHSVPTLVDDGNVIWDSHAICTYLISKFAADDHLYPCNLMQRARVDQRLHFDSGVLYPASRNANITILGGAAEVPQPQIDALYGAYETLEKFLQQDNYLVGNGITVADYCCAATVTTMEIHAPIDAAKYPRIRAWLDRLSQLPYFDDLNTKPIKFFQQFLAQKQAANK